MHALTDPCVQSRECLAPWIIDDNDKVSFPDLLPLVAHDKSGNKL
jgi:cytochrome c peroxidase